MIYVKQFPRKCQQKARGNIMIRVEFKERHLKEKTEG